MSVEERDRAKLAVLSLGGTIASEASGEANDLGGASPRLGGQDLVATVAQATTWASVEAHSFRCVPSPSLSLRDIVDVAVTAREIIAHGVDAVVITQGTDTMEETAYALQLLWDSPQPIVLTGAMRVADSLGPDGPTNLLAALQTAAADDARGVGALVVMADEIHAARWVVKRHTSGVTAFESPMVGPIGWISEGRVTIATRPLSSGCLAIPKTDEFPAVAVVALWLGDDGRLLSTLPDLGYAGLVVEGMGGGHVPSSAMERLVALSGRIPVVVASRTGAGEMLRSTYGFAGSEMDLLKSGVLSAGTLTASKARILLTLLLAHGMSGSRLRQSFERHASSSIDCQVRHA